MNSKDIADRIVAAILAQKLMPGTRLGEQALSILFDCSRTLVREALMQLAARHLAPQGQLVLYGPYLEADVPTSPGNLAFDADLRARDAAWGIRPLADVLVQAARVGLHLRERVAMPANNLLLVLARDACPPMAGPLSP